MSTFDRRTRERRARREAILEAGERALEASGYRNLRMEQVATAAELSKGTLYLYFDSKDALCAAVAARNIDGMLPRLKSQVLEAPSGLARVAAVLRHFSDHFADKPHTFRWLVDWLLTPEVDDGSRDFAAYRQRVGEVFAMLTEALREGQRDGSVQPELDPLHHAIQLWSSGVGAHLVRHNATAFERRLGRPFDPERVVNLHLASQLRAIAVDPAMVGAALASDFMEASA